MDAGSGRWSGRNPPGSSTQPSGAPGTGWPHAGALGDYAGLALSGGWSYDSLSSGLLVQLRCLPLAAACCVSPPGTTVRSLGGACACPTSEVGRTRRRANVFPRNTLAWGWGDVPGRSPSSHLDLPTNVVRVPRHLPADRPRRPPRSLRRSTADPRCGNNTARSHRVISLDNAIREAQTRRRHDHAECARPRILPTIASMKMTG